MKHSALFFLGLLLSSQIFAHGEDKPGPHGGVIRMPGAFHTEVVSEKSGDLKVYLLDLEWKNPTTKDSSVVLVFEQKKKIEVACRAQNDHFACKLPGSVSLKKGKLLVYAIREKAKGNEASYELPLQLAKKESVHSGH